MRQGSPGLRQKVSCVGQTDLNLKLGSLKYAYKIRKQSNDQLLSILLC